MCLPSVLIETLWNVKENFVEEINRVFGINRNIVECKDGPKIVTMAAALVLIETLWNVKPAKKMNHPSNCRSINRNIVECKDQVLIYFHNHNVVLIETLWNVKFPTLQA